MNWTATGHRSDKLDLHTEGQVQQLLKFADDIVHKYFKSPDKTTMYCGMQSGWDLAVGSAAYKQGHQVICCVPYDGFLPFSKDNKRLWYSIASELLIHNPKVVVCPGSYAAWKLNKRNEYMVNNSTFIIALYDGGSGGTKNCLDYADKKSVFYQNHWDEWVNVIK